LPAPAAFRPDLPVAHGSLSALQRSRPRLCWRPEGAARRGRAGTELQRGRPGRRGGHRTRKGGKKKRGRRLGKSGAWREKGGAPSGGRRGRRVSWTPPGSLAGLSSRLPNSADFWPTQAGAPRQCNTRRQCRWRPRGSGSPRYAWRKPRSMGSERSPGALGVSGPRIRADLQVPSQTPHLLTRTLHISQPISVLRPPPRLPQRPFPPHPNLVVAQNWWFIQGPPPGPACKSATHQT
jgi:hypothetical protein